MMRGRAALALVAALTGCFELEGLSPDVRIACSPEDTNCPDGFYCNIQRWECRRFDCTRDCADGEQCVDGLCVDWTGCETSLEGGSDGYGCATCVCETFPSCCDGPWDAGCAQQCRVCGSCGALPGLDRCSGDACPELDWAAVPAGRFDMGSDDPADDASARPVHGVDLDAFELARTEVTVAQYQTCVDAGACAAPIQDNDLCNWHMPGRGDHPVNCLSWRQAWQFAHWVGARLPSEAEWEYAARSAGAFPRYPWGEAAPSCERAVIDEGGRGCGQGNISWPVCSKPAGSSRQGLCDLLGNVAELVEDDWHDDYTGAPDGGGAWVDEPRVLRRVLRGPGFDYEAGAVHARIRMGNHPRFAYHTIGFRPARPVAPQEDR